MCAPPLNRFGSNSNKKNYFFVFFSLDFFAGRFLLRPWGICSFCFPPHNVHIFQVMWSNFIKNPFCYFSISSINSKSPISQIFCVNVLESVQKIFFFMRNIEKSLFFSAYFFSIRHLGGQVSLGHPLTIFRGKVGCSNSKSILFMCIYNGSNTSNSESSGNSKTSSHGNCQRQQQQQ